MLVGLWGVMHVRRRRVGPGRVHGKSPESGTPNVEALHLKPFFHFSRLERDSKLSALEERADALQDGSAQFEKRAASLKNKFWLENLKSMIMMGVVGLILAGVVYWQFFHQPAQPQMYCPPPPPPPPPQAPAAAPAGDSGGDGGGGSEAASDGGE